MSITNYQDNFIRVRNVPNKYLPEVQYREVERVKVGTWFFGLFPVYEYRYTEWKDENT